MFYENVSPWRPMEEFDRLAEHQGEHFLNQQFDVMVYSEDAEEYISFRCCIWSSVKNDFYTPHANQPVSRAGRPIYWRESSGALQPEGGCVPHTTRIYTRKLFLTE